MSVIVNNLDNEVKIPYVSHDLLDYLKVVFNPNMLLDKRTSSAEALVGYMQGCRDVIAHLSTLRDAKEDAD